MKSRAIVLPAELQKQLSSAVGFKFNILPECSNLENKGELYMNSDSPSAEGYIPHGFCWHQRLKAGRRDTK